MPTIVATEPLATALGGIAFLSVMTVFVLGLPPFAGYLVLFRMKGGEFLVSPVVTKITACVFLLGFEVFVGRVLLGAMRGSLRRLRQPVVFRLDPHALHIDGRDHPLHTLKEIVVDCSTIDGTTWGVQARTDDGVVTLVCGLDDEEDARWLAMQCSSHQVQKRLPALVPSEVVEEVADEADVLIDAPASRAGRGDASRR